MQVSVLDNTQVLNDIGVEIVIVEAAIVFEVVRIAIDVDIIQQLIVLNWLLDTWLLFLGHLSWDIGYHR